MKEINCGNLHRFCTWIKIRTTIQSLYLMLNLHMFTIHFSMFRANWAKKGGKWQTSFHSSFTSQFKLESLSKNTFEKCWILQKLLMFWWERLSVNFLHCIFHTTLHHLLLPTVHSFANLLLIYCSLLQYIMGDTLRGNSANYSKWRFEKWETISCNALANNMIKGFLIACFSSGFKILCFVISFDSFLSWLVIWLFGHNKGNLSFQIVTLDFTFVGKEPVIFKELTESETLKISFPLSPHLYCRLPLN